MNRGRRQEFLRALAAALRTGRVLFAPEGARVLKDRLARFALEIEGGHLSYCSENPQKSQHGFGYPCGLSFINDTEFLQAETCSCVHEGNRPGEESHIQKRVSA